MAGKYSAPGFSSGEIYLPAAGAALEKWAVVACDQFTSQQDYWDEVEKTVGGAPSTLRLTLPEIYLSQTETRIGEIRQAMNGYLDSGVIAPAVDDGFILVDRETTQGHRLGLIGMIDLEEYDYTPGAKKLVRPTEGTIPERVPPRARIRSGAPMELPHVMMLIDDPACSVIEALNAQRGTMRSLYDFDLMLDGGHINGYAVEGAHAAQAAKALTALWEKSNGLLYAVGDGNHSLAAARSCWNEIKKTLTDEEAENHPARRAMVELVNIHCPALVFEPIHRILKGVSGVAILEEYSQFLREKGIAPDKGSDVRVVFDSNEIGFGFAKHPLADLQEFLGSYASAHPGVELDYIHGEADLRQLAVDGCVGFLLRPFDKADLFPFIRERGVLPRKAFSMGEARDKRYYLEARRLTV